MASDEVLRTTIDGYLLALADGLVHAQARLDEATFGGEGRDRTAYTIPRLDFELRLLMETAAEARFGGDAGIANPSAPTVLVRSPTGTESAMRAHAELLSTLRGSIVAMPASDRRPALVLRAALGSKTASGRAITVGVARSSGEAAAGVAVELNLDLERSAALSKAAGVTWSGPNAGTFITDGVLVTGADGSATTTLTIAAGELSGAVLLVAIDAPGAGVSVAVKVD